MRRSRSARLWALVAIVIFHCVSCATAAPLPATPLSPVVAQPATIADLVRLPVYGSGGAAAGPLAVRSVSFGQRGLNLLLTLRTAGEFDFPDLGRNGGASICVDAFVTADAVVPVTRLCAAGSEQRPLIRATTYDEHGRPGTPADLPLTVYRSDRTTFVADVPPPSVGLAERSFYWRLTTTWTSSGPCSPQTPCVDRVPATGAYPVATRLLAAPRCFGAAARPNKGRCSNPSLRTAVVPVPDVAVLQGNSFCFPTGRQGVLNPCRFRAAPLAPSATIALLGDSHASHWRGGLTVVANARNWEGISITRSGCRYSTAPPTIKAAQQRRDCVTFRGQARQWLAGHPEVGTVFISNHVGTFMSPRSWRQAVAGARRAIEALPASVEHVYVIRDVPRDATLTFDCVTGALAQRRPAGPACAVPRRWALPPDPTATAARRTKRRGVAVLDLTRRFCSSTHCFPVVGGALVHNDTEHLSDTFSTTLGPVLLGRLDTLRRRGQ